MEIENLDHTLLAVSSCLAEPLCWAYGCLRYRLVAPFGKFDTYSNTLGELSYRTGIVAGTILGTIYAPVPLLATTVTLGVGSKPFRAAGFYFQENGLTHIRGGLPETTL